MKTKGLTLALQVALLTFFLILAVAPIMLMWMSAFKTRQQISVAPLALPTSITLDNLVQAWTVGRFGQYVGNSILVTIPVVLGVVALSAMAGYGFARYRFWGHQVIFYAFLIGLMVPFQSIMIPLYFNIKNLGLLGTYWAMILPAIGLGLPFGIFLLQSFFRGLPQELGDSARVDGCNEFQVFWRVLLPLAKPAVSSLVVFQFMWTWNAYLMPLLLLNQEALRPITLGLMFFQGRYTSDYALISAGIMIVTLPIILVYILMQRQFLRGLTAGALRG
jgi:ABC-type glycerol-3-phosphate transport system permease component